MRVVIADDSLLVREGIASLLRRAGFDVVAEAESGEELMPAVDAHEPELALVDVRMPPTYTEEGLRAAHEIRARHPRIGVVILSQNVEVGVAMRLLAETPAGLGYLLKDRAQQRLVSLAIALRMTEDRIHDDPAMAAGLVAAARKEV